MTDTNAQVVGSDTRTKLALLDRASAEIATYRRRQLTTFREMAIVQGLITVGLGQLHIEHQPMRLWIRSLAGVSCILAAIVGVWIIRSYKKRIYYIRDRRAKLVSAVSEDPLLQVYYPTRGQELEEKEYQTSPTSRIYSVTLLALGVLTLLGNILAGLAN